jgi:hypothetical protein
VKMGARMHEGGESGMGCMAAHEGRDRHESYSEVCRGGELPAVERYCPDARSTQPSSVRIRIPFTPH